MIKSYSKVNLFLRVLKKNSYGLHNIQSATMLLDLHDEIKINKINKSRDEVIFTGSFKNSINKYSNTVISALHILRSQNLISEFKRCTKEDFTDNRVEQVNPKYFSLKFCPDMELVKDELKL